MIFVLTGLRGKTFLLVQNPMFYEGLTYVITGMLNKQIAYDLKISEKTVKVHRGRVMGKMGVDSVAQLVRLADKVGVQPADISE